MDAEKRLSMFQALQEVKAQHYIGSVDAYRYLKDRKRMDDLMIIVREIKKAEVEEIDEEKIRKYLHGLVDFREMLIQLILDQIKITRFVNYEVDDFDFLLDVDSDLFGSEESYIRWILDPAPISVYGFFDDIKLMARAQKFMLPNLRDNFGAIPSDEFLKRIFQNRIYPVLLSFFRCMEGQCEEGAGHPFFPGVSEIYALFEEFLNLFERGCLGNLPIPIEMLLSSDMKSTAERRVDSFYPPEELYRRIEREQIMHNIWLQRELVISWIEKYPVNDYTVRYDIDRIGSFEDAISMVECDLSLARERYDKEKKMLDYALEKVSELEHPSFPPMLLERQKSLVEGHESELSRRERDVRAYEFIRTQLFRHRRFLEKFLSA